MQPRITAKVICTDREVGEVSYVIADPIAKSVSHLVIKADGRESVVAIDGLIAGCTEREVRLTCASGALAAASAPFRRDDFVTIHDVEIPHLERNLDQVTPGGVLVPLPVLEKDLSRRQFFTRFTNVIGAMLALPLVFPVVRYLIYPLYQPFTNLWIKLGAINAMGQEPGVPKLFKFQKTVLEGYITRHYEKSHWVIKLTPELRDKIYPNGDHEFRDDKGTLIWVNKKDADIAVLSGKCTHLGCAFRWRKHKRFGQVFVCPCHLSVFDPSGTVLDGPAPRRLDVLPLKISGSGEVEIIDMEFKAGKAEQVRIA
ncbi:MAG: ubiquinol-cytochrome c reductase iron-sulfur subunit [Nitrospirae bacterium]|nr:ubiquinol-cytochrome c reductase iron-sulfur subunit [Nitrospirota bacterium]